MQPDHVVIIDIDGLRPDVFRQALAEGRLPNFSRLFGGDQMPRGMQIPILATAPSSTFVSQASLFTGAHPAQHMVLGNEYFDRLGLISGGTPRHFGFNVGETYSADDAMRAFLDGLASKALQAPTLYEQLSDRGWRAVVIGHMYARGAEWLRPSLVSLARLTKGGKLFGIEAEEFDRHLLEKGLDYLEEHGLPPILTQYFLGIDHLSHAHGPVAQDAYLTGTLDGFVGELLDSIAGVKAEHSNIFFVVCSDHGEIGVIPDERHALQVGSGSERGIGDLFEALDVDVMDFPGEDPDSQAVFSGDGGLAQVYLKPQDADWGQAPEFDRLLTMGQAFWQASNSARYTPMLEGALAAVLVRDAQDEGWNSPYRALMPDGELLALSRFFVAQPDGLYADPVQRLNHMSCATSGDLLLLSRYEQGFYFSGPTTGVHGGLHPEDSSATLAYGWPDATQDAWQAAKRIIRQAIEARCQKEAGRQAGTVDMLTGLLAVLPEGARRPVD